jgi:hypothetical protein
MVIVGSEVLTAKLAKVFLQIHFEWVSLTENAGAMVLDSLQRSVESIARESDVF